MLSNGYVNLDSILERVKRKFGFSEVDRYDTAEQIWEVINYLGIVYAFERKNIPNISFNNYRIKVPIDFVDFGFQGGIRDSYTGQPLIQSSDVFQIINKFIGITVTDVFEGPNVTIDYTTTPSTLNDSTAFVETMGMAIMGQQLTYDRQGDYFYLGYNKGKLDIIYNAFPISSDGTPKVPDDAKYIRAVVDYIGYMIAFKLKLRNLISADDLNRIERDYYHSAGSAKTKALTPDLATMETIRRFSQRLIPQYSQFASGFRHMGDQEMLRNI